MILRPMIIVCANLMSFSLPSGGLKERLGHLEEPGKAAGLHFWLVVLIRQSEQLVQKNVRLEDGLSFAFFKGPAQGNKVAQG